MSSTNSKKGSRAVLGLSSRARGSSANTEADADTELKDGVSEMQGMLSASAFGFGDEVSIIATVTM